jgi:PAS domain S-box-containing protein
VTSLKPKTIVATYSIVSALWILFSDNAVAILFGSSQAALVWANTLKGWFYVAVVSSLLWSMLKQYETKTNRQAQALTQREGRLRMLLENAGDAIYLATPDGSIVDVNPEAQRQTGFSREELLAMTIFDVDLDASSESLEQLGSAISIGRGATFESRHRRKDGGFVPVEIRVAAIEESEGRRFLFGVVRDITERKRAEDELRRSEEKFRTIADFTHDWEYWIGLDGGFIWCSPSCLRLTGHSPDEFMADAGLFLRLLHPADVPAFAAHVEAMAFSGSAPCDMDLRIFKRSGEMVWINHSCLPVLAPDGSNLGRRGCNRDITARKLSEENLLRNRMMLANIINSVPQAIFWKDRASVYQGCNETFAKYAGLSDPDKIVGMTDYDLPWLPEESDGYRADDKDVMDSNQPKRHIIEQQLQSDGRRVWVDTSKVPMLDPAGQVKGVLGIYEDITERRRLQETIVQSEKMMSVGGLAAGMAHEINNPLGGILQSAQVLAARLREELPANLRQAQEAGCDFQAMRGYMERRGVFDLLDAIRESAVRAAKIVANMLDFSRRGPKDFVPEDVNAIISGALDLASNDYDLLKKYDFRAIRIDKDLDPSLPPVKCSPIEIEQVVLNLLKNAAHALASRSDPSKTPAIRLHTCLEADHVVIEVADNGPGMTPAVLRHAFEPFFTTKEPGLGTGLGLSVSYFIVTSHHNGSIEVESELGAGAKFIIRLPV